MAIALTLSLAGCLGNSVKISKSGGGTVNDSKSLECPGTGRVSWTLNGGQALDIKVYDGNADEIFEKDGMTGGSDSGSQKLSGTPGNWRLTVTGSYGGQFSVSLDC